MNIRGRLPRQKPRKPYSRCTVAAAFAHCREKFMEDASIIKDVCRILNYSVSTVALFHSIAQATATRCFENFVSTFFCRLCHKLTFSESYFVKSSRVTSVRACTRVLANYQLDIVYFLLFNPGSSSVGFSFKYLLLMTVFITIELYFLVLLAFLHYYL